MRIPCADLQDQGLLRPLRVLVPGDVLTRLPPRQIGAMHGVQPRLVLDPPRTLRPTARSSRRSSRTDSDAQLGPAVPTPPSIRFRDGTGDDDDLWKRRPDLHAHTSHALFLSGECTPKRPQTVPLAEAWPIACMPDTPGEAGVGSQGPCIGSP